MQPISWPAFFKPLTKKPVFIAGFSALTGLANAKLLLKYNVPVILLEEDFNKTKQKLLRQLVFFIPQSAAVKQKSSRNKRYAFACPMVYTKLAAASGLAKKLNAKHLIISPGMPRSNKHIVAMQQQGVKVWSDFDFFYPLYSHKTLVALSGTNGKTSTALLITHLLNGTLKKTKKGSQQMPCKKALVVGNIGTPIAALLCGAKKFNASNLQEISTKNLKEIKQKKQSKANPHLALQSQFENAKVLVFELSSYMLEKINRFKANVSLLTNFASDHLDRYKTKAYYFSAKTNIVKGTHPNGVFILNGNCQNLCTFKPLKSALVKNNITVVFTQNESIKLQNCTLNDIQNSFTKAGVKFLKNVSVVYKKEKKLQANKANHNAKNNTHANYFFSLNYGEKQALKINNKGKLRKIFLPTENILLSLAAVLAVKHCHKKNFPLPNVQKIEIQQNKLASSLPTFLPPSHRMQCVQHPKHPNRKIQGKAKTSAFLFSPLQKLLEKSLVINDSKATTVQSVEMALSFFFNVPKTTKIVLLLGGENKNLSFKPLLKTLKAMLPSIERIVCYGHSAKEIESQLMPLNQLFFNQLFNEASKKSATSNINNSNDSGDNANKEKLLVTHTKFAHAFKSCCLACETALAKKSPFVFLLSPGCASFDQFANFTKRGDTFGKLSAKWLSKLYNKA